MEPLKSVTLEMSLKPFRSAEQGEVETVCRAMFEAWRPLVRHAETVCVLLWAADGSEILEYAGDGNAPLEWARYIGGANPRQDWDRKNAPEGAGMPPRW